MWRQKERLRQKAKGKGAKGAKIIKKHRTKMFRLLAVPTVA